MRGGRADDACSWTLISLSWDGGGVKEGVGEWRGTKASGIYKHTHTQTAMRLYSVKME